MNKSNKPEKCKFYCTFCYICSELVCNILNLLKFTDNPNSYQDGSLDALG